MSPLRWTGGQAVPPGSIAVTETGGQALCHGIVAFRAVVRHRSEVSVVLALREPVWAVLPATISTPSLEARRYSIRRKLAGSR